MEPVDVTAAKLHSRIDNDTEDSLVSAFITTAREWCEQYQKERAYLTQTWELSFDHYPIFPIAIPKYPLQSVTIKYYIEDGSTGTEATWNSINYFIDYDSIPPRISLSEDGQLPTDDLVPLGGFKVQFVVGYETVNDVSESVKSAIKLLTGHLYENREASTPTALQDIPFGIKALLGMDRW